MDMTRLVHLHRKYCSGNVDGSSESIKSIEDLQKDLYSCSDDFRRLEVYLQGGHVAYWTEIDDFILAQCAEAGGENNLAYQKMLKVKGPAEVYDRQYFLKLITN